jgi:ubiquitin-conjugating enzyme E2 T
MQGMQARRMARELAMLSTSAPPGVTAWPRDDGAAGCGGGARLDELDAEIVGAAETPYAGGVFRLRVSIPPEYPIKPPSVRFISRIYHPNIDAQGRICLDTLNMPPKGAWKPSLNVSTVLASVQLLMSHPNPDDGLMADITDEFRRFPDRFYATAKTWTARYASGAVEEPAEGVAADAAVDAARVEAVNTMQPGPVEQGDAAAVTSARQHETGETLQKDAAPSPSLLKRAACTPGSAMTELKENTLDGFPNSSDDDDDDDIPDIPESEVVKDAAPPTTPKAAEAAGVEAVVDIDEMDHVSDSSQDYVRDAAKSVTPTKCLAAKSPKLARPEVAATSPRAREHRWPTPRRKLSAALRRTAPATFPTPASAGAAVEPVIDLDGDGVDEPIVVSRALGETISPRCGLRRKVAEDKPALSQPDASRGTRLKRRRREK